MHETALHFAKTQIAAYGPFRRVIELGSLNINGTPRIIFDDSVEYVGVDLQEGPGVDIVSDICNLDAHADFDLVICMEVLEHAPDQAGVIRKAFDLLAPGGILVLTAACEPRRPHSGIDENPIRDFEHYRNADPAELAQMLEPFGWSAIDTSVLADVYAVAQK